MTGQMTIFDMGVERPSHWEIDIDNDESKERNEENRNTIRILQQIFPQMFSRTANDV